MRCMTRFDKGVTPDRKRKTPQNKTAKQKLNGSYFHGALIIAGLLGAISGSWTVFLIATGVLVATSMHDGSIRL